LVSEVGWGEYGYNENECMRRRRREEGGGGQKSHGMCQCYTPGQMNERDG